jgi:hypothetical protein
MGIPKSLQKTRFANTGFTEKKDVLCLLSRAGIGVCLLHAGHDPLDLRKTAK